jgi:hypothetical protein
MGFGSLVFDVVLGPALHLLDRALRIMGHLRFGGANAARIGNER